MTRTIRRVRVEEYVYYVTKLRQTVGLETWIWRQIATSQTAYTKYKWPPYVTEWRPPHGNFLRTPLCDLLPLTHALHGSALGGLCKHKHTQCTPERTYATHVLVTVSGVSRVWQAWLVPWAPLCWERKIYLAKLKICGLQFLQSLFCAPYNY